MALKISGNTRSINLTRSDLVFPNSDIVKRDAFKDDVELTEVELGEGITEIREGAFADCINLTTIKFPSTLKLIRQNAFTGCRSLKTIILPDTLEDVECWFANRGGKFCLRPPFSDDLIHHLLDSQGEIDLYYKGEFRDDHWD
jgi:hypothetical protein